MTRDSITDQPTNPDLNALWSMCIALHAELRRHARWRITHTDWNYLRAQSPGHRPHPIQPPRYSADPHEPWTLFGVPVDVVPTERHRWPELVLISDRRTH